MKLETMKQMGDNHHPMQSLCLTFTPGIDGIRMLSVLRHYAEKGYVAFESDVLVQAILVSQDWACTGRKLMVYFRGGALWGELDFLKLAERGVESIRVASDSPLNALQSGRQKKREGALESIAKGVLTPELLREFSEWDLTVEHSIVEMHGLFSMWVVVKSGEHIKITIVLDGWSGNIISTSGVIISFCSSFQTVQNELRKKLAEYLEEATA